MKFDSIVEKKVYQRMEKGNSDQDIKYIINCLYLNFPIDGPYTSLKKCIFGSKPACEDHAKREMYKTLILGEYGKPCAVAYTICGTPARGKVFATDHYVVLDLQGDTKIIKRYDGYSSLTFRKSLCLYFIGCFKKEKDDHRVSAT